MRSCIFYGEGRHVCLRNHRGLGPKRKRSTLASLMSASDHDHKRLTPQCSNAGLGWKLSKLVALRGREIWLRAPIQVNIKSSQLRIQKRNYHESAVAIYTPLSPSNLDSNETRTSSASFETLKLQKPKSEEVNGLSVRTRRGGRVWSNLGIDSRLQTQKKDGGISQTRVRRVLQYWSSTKIGKRLRTRRSSPLAALSQWLAENVIRTPTAQRMKYVERLADARLSLPTIVLHYLRLTASAKGPQYPDGPPKSIPKTVFPEKMIAKLKESGFSPQDVPLWAWIITAETGEVAAQRFIELPGLKPSFLLLNILDRHNIHSSTLRRLILQSWAYVIGPASSSISSGPDGAVAVRISGLSGRKERKSSIELTSFMMMISSLLRHARKVFPEAQMSISSMIPRYFEQITDNPSNNIILASKRRWRLCKLYNRVIRLLSLPAAMNPLKSMAHNWDAQRMLLESAGNFGRPLELDQGSYRAVARVLGALKKSDEELKFARFMERTWPPWRNDQDGIDARRPRTDDLSRVAKVLARMKEAGYSEEAVDRATKILGGRDSDGTPTVVTRSLSTWRAKEPSTDKGDEWSARIRATRDVQEAWNAFLAFDALQRKPTLDVFNAMFEKLIFDKARLNRKREHYPTPGDGKEVIAVSNANVSDSEKLRVQPPSIDKLYFRMRKDGLRPQGRILALLVGHASSLKWAGTYLRDSDIPFPAVKVLIGQSKIESSKALLSVIPDPIFAAYMKLLSRFKIYERQMNKRYSNPDLWKHMFQLMRVRNSTYRPIWNIMFRTIMREINHGKLSVGQTNLSAIQTWLLLEACFNDSYIAGVELDPEGFQVMCMGLERTILQLPETGNGEYVILDQKDGVHDRKDGEQNLIVGENNRTPLEPLGRPEVDSAILTRGLEMVKDGFRNLSRKSSPQLMLPSFVYKVGQSELHSYVRVLGVAGDLEEVVALMRWMVDNEERVQKLAMESQSGSIRLRRTLVAMRVFAEDQVTAGDDHVIPSLRGLMNQVETWGGWPTDEEVSQYRAYGKDSLEAKFEMES